MVRRLSLHLIPAARAELGVDFWTDASVTAGSSWTEMHGDIIPHASVFILCMSADYLASEFVYNAELPTIIKQSWSRGALVIPVILRPCAWWGFVGDLQVVPTNKGRVIPVSDWHPHEKGYFRAAFEIIQGIRSHLSLSAGQSEPSEPKTVFTGPRPIQPAPPGPHRVSPPDIDRAVKTVIARRTGENDV
jgi:hypothetical protein